MTPSFDKVQQLLKRLPGLGYRSAERIALHLLVEKPEALPPLLEALQDAQQRLGRCTRCGNIAEDELCEVCADGSRNTGLVCVVEQVPDLAAMERAGAFRGVYHVLHGKLSPIHDVGPGDLNLASLGQRIESGAIEEIILALSNDIEGEATCHYIQEELIGERDIQISRIGFGLPSGGGLTYADAVTLRSALDSRRQLRD